MKNTGKIFEEEFKASIPKNIYYLRLPDAALGFDIENSKQRFSLKSPYDTILCKNGQMYCFELKSNTHNTMSFEGKTPRIKRRQIENLVKAQEAGAFAGALLNFRKREETYYMQADILLNFMNTCGKKSINIEDAKRLGILVSCKKLKVYYRYDIETLIKNLNQKIEL